MKLRLGFLALVLLGGATQQASSVGEFVETTNELGLGIAASSDQGPGCGFADIDSDGDLDLMVVDGLGDPNVFFRQDGLRNFVETAGTIGLDDDGWGKSVTFADYDNDGDPDMLLTRLGDSNVLCRNDGGVFTDVSDTAGFDFIGQNSGAAWADYDLDGYIDVYITTYNSQPNRLMRNMGDGTFQNVTADAGVEDATGYGFQPAWLDYDNDGWSDIYVSNDVFGTANALFRNNGDGTFSDVSASSGAGIDMSAMGIAVGDFNNNGLLDIYVANIATGNVLLQNDGDGTFTERAEELGVEAGVIAWGVNFLDFDHDGRLDLYCNVSSDDYFAPPGDSDAPSYQERVTQLMGGGGEYPNLLFRNNGVTFDNVSVGSGIEDGGRSFSSAVADYDNDGDLDIYVTNWYVVQTDSLTSMFENTHVPRGSAATDWLRIRLIGTTSNRDGVGTRVWIETTDGWQVRERNIGTSYLACSDPYLHFGTGNSSVVSKLYVRWPSGLGELYENVPAGQVLTLVEGFGTATDVPGVPGKADTASRKTGKIRISPNPSSGAAVLNWNSNTASHSTRVWITDAAGRRVWSASHPLSASESQIRWDGRDAKGRRVPTGTYFVYLRTGEGQHHSGRAHVVR